MWARKSVPRMSWGGEPAHVGQGQWPWRVGTSRRRVLRAGLVSAASGVLPDNSLPRGWLSTKVELSGRWCVLFRARTVRAGRGRGSSF